jgi:hypothetical protein
VSIFRRITPRPPRPQRPTDLRRVPLSFAIPLRKGRCTITMSIGQWDAMLAAAYRDGWTLLELDDDERPIAAYCAEEAA